MSQYFERQSNLVISLDTGISLTGATSTQILYEKPNGVKGAWTASVTGTVLNYTLQNNDIDQNGRWSFQSFVVIGGKNYYGEIVNKHFSKPLN